MKSLLIVCLLFVLKYTVIHASPMIVMLDLMQKMMTGEPQFNRKFYYKLVNCMNSIDPMLKSSQDGAWKGLADYWDMRGAPNDIWGQKRTPFREYNLTYMGIRNIVIYEPCNFASNVAYYRPIMEICGRLSSRRKFSIPNKFIQSLATSFGYLVVGSSFMHGSNTNLGAQQDVKMMSVMAYQIHQVIFDGQTKSPVLHDLTNHFRNFTAYQQIESLKFMFIKLPVTEWFNHTRDLDIPNYYLTFSALVASVLHMGFSPRIANVIFSALSTMLQFPPEIEKFLIEKYIPELRTILKKLKMPTFERRKFARNTIGTVIKFGYAFLWQEELLTTNPILNLRAVKFLGASLIPGINFQASLFQSFRYSDYGFQAGIDMYPGDTHCRSSVAHATWHVQSAIGLLDMVYLADEAYRIFSTLTI